MSVCLTAEVGKFARDEVRQFNHRRSQLNHAGPFLAWFTRHPFAWLTGFVVGQIDRVARDFAKQALLFKGAREIVSERSIELPLDPNFETVDLLEGMERNLLTIREATLKLVELRQRLGRGERLTNALRGVAGAAADLYESVLGFKGAVLEFEGSRAAMEVSMAANSLAFSPEAAVEAILYIVERLDRHVSFHEVLKLRYFADTLHLSHYGSMASGDTYKAMKFGPVGSNSYNLLKAARGDQSEWIHPKFLEVTSDAFSVKDGKWVEPKRGPNMDYLSISERRCIDEAIKRYGNMTFAQRTALSHDAAWKEAFEEAQEDQLLAGQMNVVSIARTLENADEVLEHLRT